jgi:GWxTD domain-containing protein
MWLHKSKRPFVRRSKVVTAASTRKQIRPALSISAARGIEAFPRFLLLLGCFLGMPGNLLAQSSSAFSQPRAFVDFDQTLGMSPYVFRTYQFAAADFGKAAPAAVRLEVYIGMVNDILQFVKTSSNDSLEGRYRAQYEVNVTVWDKKGNPVASRNWKRDLFTDSFDATNDRKKLNLERTFFDLAPGEYEVSLEITDRDTGKNLREKRQLKLGSFGGDELQVSSIVLTQPLRVAREAPRAQPLPNQRSVSSEVQRKDSWAALPESWKTSSCTALRDSLPYNITSILTNLPPVASRAESSQQPDGASESAARSQEAAVPRGPDWFGGPGAYFEIYGAASGEILQMQFEIRDWRGQIVQEWKETITVSQSPVCHLAFFDGKLGMPGQHTFRLTVKRAEAGPDQSGRRNEVTAEENFQVQISAGRSYTAQFLENKALLYEPLRYVAKGAEYKRMAEADEARRDSLVAEFWRQRDPQPEKEFNALREEFYRRVAFAEMRFAVPILNKPGWQTDRGRIYIIYGPPKEVHHQMAEQGSPPYEIWFYPAHDLYFVFRDKNGSGDYELVNR